MRDRRTMPRSIIETIGVTLCDQSHTTIVFRLNRVRMGWKRRLLRCFDMRARSHRMTYRSFVSEKMAVALQRRNQ